MSVNHEPLLAIDGLAAGYGAVPILHDVRLEMRRGETVALLGSNGVGKSTLLRVISGLIPASAGTIRFAGEDIKGVAPHKIVRRGLLHVPEGRRLFSKQTVASNLELGLFGVGVDAEEKQRRIEAALDLFPALKPRLAVYAGLLSGGQQQMLAIAQGLVREPQLLMLDEPSLGLAPVIIDEVFAALSTIRDQGSTVLIAEQMAERALRLAERAYILSHGRVVAEGTADELLGSQALEQAYLGAGAEL